MSDAEDAGEDADDKHHLGSYESMTRQMGMQVIDKEKTDWDSDASKISGAAMATRAQYNLRCATGIVCDSMLKSHHIRATTGTNPA